MVSVEKFVESLKSAGVDFFVGVPDLLVACTSRQNSNMILKSHVTTDSNQFCKGVERP